MGHNTRIYKTAWQVHEITGKLTYLHDGNYVDIPVNSSFGTIPRIN